MTTETTPAAPGQRIDELIPAPWPTRRRVLVLALAVALVAVVLVSIRSGVTWPQLVHDDGWGWSVDASDPNRLVAQRHVPLRNRGWTAVAVERLQLPELDGIAWGEVRGLPVTLPPGGQHEVIVAFEAAGCDLDVGGYDEFRFRARSGIAPERTVTVRSPGSSDPTMRATYLDSDGDAVTLPPWPDQPPSWILDTIEPECATPPDGFDG